MVKQGYKETEVGLIPQCWDVLNLQECASFLDHKRIPIKDSDRKKMRGSYPYYGASGIIDYVDSYIFDGTYILLGEDGANIIDRSSRLSFIVSGKCWINNHAHVISPNCLMDIYFLSEYLESIKYDEYNTGTAQPKLNREKCNGIPIPVPPLEEQKRIAEALSDVDSMISSLEKLVAKKKAVKQGAMQELLTGKKRLPGFTGEWKCEANIFSFSKGTQINSSLLNETDIYPVYNGGREPSGFTDKFNCSRSIIISEGGNSCGFVNMVRQNFWAGGHCYYVYETALDYEFLYHLLKFNENEIMGLRVGSGLPNIQKDALSKLEFTYPLDMLEQTAIASIISDMDNEIESLEQKLAKARQIKQGMMQQLLTGKIRLV